MYVKVAIWETTGHCSFSIFSLGYLGGQSVSVRDYRMCKVPSFYTPSSAASTVLEPETKIRLPLVMIKEVTTTQEFSGREVAIIIH